MTPSKIEVPGAGSYSAKILFVDECPGKTEVETGLNLSGPSGEVLWEILYPMGLRRPNIYMTSIYKVRLLGDSTSNLDKTLTKEEQEKHREFLWREIESIKPNLIVALGNTALNVLTGNDGILKWRGSILRSLRYGIKVIPTIHPKSLLEYGGGDEKELFSWKQIVFLQFDLRKAIKEMETPQFNIPRRNIIIAKDSQTMWQYFDRKKNAEKCVNDIETYKSLPHCAGVAYDPYEAMVFPLFNIPGPGNSSINIPRYERIEMWKMYARFLNSPIKKIGQNYDFDIDRQEQFGFKVGGGCYSDIMLKMSVIYPELPKKLAVSTSIFTNQPFYKDEGREYHPKKDNPDRLMNYCGLDCTSTYEIDEQLEFEFDKIRRN